MGITYNPRIVTDGLVLALDAGNPISYDGSENLITHSSTTSGIVLGVLGSGGSLPTGWGIDQGQPGTTLEIVGYGVENGLNYIDLKFSGTTTTSNRWLVRPGNPLTLTSGVTYNSSVYAKTISGTPTDYRSFYNAYLALTDSTLTRYSGNFTASSTGTSYPRLDIGYNSVGTVMNFTIRVAGFQLETGSTANTYYPTTGTTKIRGTTWTDVSGRGNAGTLTNGPTYSSANGGSIVFDGVDDYVQFTSTSVQTVCFWGRMDADIPSLAALVATSATGDGSLRTYPTGTFRPSTDGNDFNNGYESSLMINGVSNLSSDGSGGLTIPGGRTLFQDFYVGAIGNARNISTISHTFMGRVYKGRVYAVYLYNRKLTNNELLQNFNALRGRFGI